jgi:Zn-dependent M28 family amino/carboxypeptidase
LGLAAALITLVGVAGGGPVPSESPPQGYDPRVAELLSQVTTETLMVELERLSGRRPVTVAGAPYVIATRNTHFADAISMTTRYAQEQFTSSGLDVAYHTYTHHLFEEERRNVVAEKPGVIDPEKVYLLTAHVDNLPEAAGAPGADDNGTGSVAVMEAARLLSSEYLAHTIRFVLFTGEEQGLRGSRAYATEAAARGEAIAGVVNLDMIGYNTGQPVFDIYAWQSDDPGGVGSRHLADVFSETVTAYGLDLVPSTPAGADSLIARSDQWTFLQEGYPAILVIEDYAGDDFNPFYHTSGDTVDVVNPSYFAQLTKAAVATITGLGQRLSTGLLSATVRTPGADAQSSVTISAEDPSYWQPFTITTATDAAYTATLPVGSYTVTVRPDSPRYTPVVTRMVILTDTVTMLDLRLPGAMRLYLPWVVRPAD